MGLTPSGGVAVECAQPSLGMTMPGVPELSDTDDRILDLPPVESMLGGELLCCRLAHDEMGKPQWCDHEPTAGREALRDGSNLHIRLFDFISK